MFLGPGLCPLHAYVYMLWNNTKAFESIPTMAQWNLRTVSCVESRPLQVSLRSISGDSQQHICQRYSLFTSPALRPATCDIIRQLYTHKSALRIKSVVLGSVGQSLTPSCNLSTLNPTSLLILWFVLIMALWQIEKKKKHPYWRQAPCIIEVIYRGKVNESLKL